MSASQDPHLPALGVELSQRSGSVVVRAENGREATRRFSGGRREQDSLLPAIDEAMQELGVLPASLRLLAVDIGPGGFTGLRVSTATMQGLGEVTGAAMVGVPGAVVAAASTPEVSSSSEEILVLLAAKGETAWASRVRQDQGRWSIVGKPGLLSVLEGDPPAAALADEHLPTGFRDSLSSAGVPVFEPSFEACAVLEQAIRSTPDAQASDAAVIGPLYPREPEAVRIWRNIR